jgi:hypothetical protein
VISLTLVEGDSLLFFEALDFSGDGYVMMGDLLTYCMDIAVANDSVEGASAFKATFVKKKVKPGDLLASLIGYGGGSSSSGSSSSSSKGNKRAGEIDHAAFEKAARKLVGSSTLTSDHLSDMKRLLDPNKVQMK